MAIASPVFRRINVASNDIMNNAIFRFLADIATHPALNTSPSSIVVSSGTTADVATVAVDPIHTRSPTVVSDRTTELV